VQLGSQPRQIRALAELLPGEKVLAMKQMILGSALGRLAGATRDVIEMLRTAYLNPERLGTVANDQLATSLITRLGRPNTRFVDVGAHIGSIIAAVAQHDRSIQIVALEAMPDKVAALRKKFPTCEIHECAAGAAEGEAKFFVNTKLSGYSSLGQPADAAASDIREIRVPVKTLDGLLAPTGVDAMKIDVEGAELGVLRGAATLVTQSRPTIMFESGPQESDGLGYTKEELWQWFHEQDYGVYVPNRVAHTGQPLTRDGFVESHLYPRRTTNYFAIAAERRAEIRDRARRLLGLSNGR
jgi:FkbM family methyltransferase